MSFRSELEVVFDASSFKPNNCQKSITSPREDSRIDIWYIANNRDLNPLPFTPEKDFFLQNVREHCRSLPQSQTTIKELLNAVSVSWARAVKVTNQISALSLEYPTEVKKTSDTSIVVSSSLLLVPLETKVDFEFHLSTHSTEDGLSVVLAPQVVVIYGERFNEKKMTEVLASKAEGNVLESEDRLWSSAVLELEEKLLARARK
jgi:kinetochore protein Spc7/SPC105